MLPVLFANEAPCAPQLQRSYITSELVLLSMEYSHIVSEVHEA